jgi:ankyrin repeat protein
MSGGIVDSVKTARALLLAALLPLGVAVAGPLHDAATEGSVEDVRRLIEAGVDLGALSTTEAATALHYAAYYGHVEVAELLIDAGAEVDARGGPQRTPLHIAAMAGSVAVATLLIEHGADVDALDREPVSPLALAVITGKVPAVKLLIEHGADVNLKLAGGTTVLQGGLVNSRENEAVRREIAELLIENGADVHNVTSDERNTPLHSAAIWGCAECAEVFLAHGADIEAEDAFGHRPLHNAAASGQAGVLELLIGSGAEIDARDEKGLTPLHWASMKGRLPRFFSDWGLLHLAKVSNKNYGTTIELLIAAGANVNAKSNKGRTPLALAKKAGNQDVVAMLRRHGAR